MTDLKITTDSQSQEVCWWEVHEFINAVVAQANYGALPVAGSPAWCALADGDPRKLRAVALAGEHHVLRMETAQQALAAAQLDVSEAADWGALARKIRARNETRIPMTRRSA